MTALSPDIVKGLLTGMTREAAFTLSLPPSVAVCRHVAWYIANGGFGLSYEAIGTAERVAKQSVAEAIGRVCDRCEERAFEKKVLAVAHVYGVVL